MNVPFVAPLLVALLGGPLPAPPPTASQTCSYQPAEFVFIDIGEVQPFFSDLGGCDGLTITISPGDGTAGFSRGTDCTLHQVTTGSTGVFKVRGCEQGSVNVTISDGATVLQTIVVIVGYAS